MNTSVFNLVVAGILVVAWLYVLGRPVLSKISYLVRRMRSSDGGIDYRRPSVRSLGLILLQPMFGPVRNWRSQGLFARRRQLLIALAAMTIASCALAIVLRGPFLVLAATVALALVLYLGVAIQIGGRLVRRERYVRKRAEPPNLNIPKASDIGQVAIPVAAQRAGHDRVRQGHLALGQDDLDDGDGTETADPTLKVKGSRRRKRPLKNPSRRIVFRRPRLDSRPEASQDLSTSDWSHLEQAANDH